MRKLIVLATLAGLTASPAFAASGSFWSLGNTDFVVLLGFLLFLAVLVYFKVPGMLGGLLDKRAEGIRNDLDEARALREEAQTLLASYERKSREVQAQADRIVAHAKAEAEIAAEQAKADIQTSIQRRLAAAEAKLASAEGKAIKAVRDQAATVAIAAAREVVAGQMTAKDAGKLIDDSIVEVGSKLH